MSTQERREGERARRKQEILLAARALFAQAGFRRATMEQIAHRAQIAKGTIYLYFPTKEDLLAGLVLQALHELTAQLHTANEQHSLLHPEARLRALAEAYLAFAQRAPDYFRLLTAWEGGGIGHDVTPLHQQQIVAASNQALELVAQAIADGMALHLFTCTDARQAAAVLWAGLNGSLTLLTHPIRRAMVGHDVANLYRATLAVLLRGLCKPLDVA